MITIGIKHGVSPFDIQQIPVRILKIARAIADLSNCDMIMEEHIAEAIQYRTLDRNWFG